MTPKAGRTIRPATGRLAVLTPGMGAVATTFFAGIEAVRRGLGMPTGSCTQLGGIRLGTGADGRNALVKEFVPLASTNDLVLGGWDIFPEDAFAAAARARVLEPALLEHLREPLEQIQP